MAQRIISYGVTAKAKRHLAPAILSVSRPESMN